MSHIRNKEDLLKLKKYIEELDSANLSIKTINDALGDLIPKNMYGKNLVGAVVTDSGITPAAYIPKFNTINISRKSFISNSDNSVKVLEDSIGIKHAKNLKGYYRLFSLLHEVEHGYQFLIAKDEIPFEHEEVKNGYKNIIRAIQKTSYIIPRPIKELKQARAFFKYQKNAYDYILERNASVEAAQDIRTLANDEKNDKVSEIFDELCDAMKYIGYEDDNKGCMFKTHQGLWLLKDYNKLEKEETDENTRLRFGLEVGEKTRNKLLEKIKRSKINL